MIGLIITLVTGYAKEDYFQQAFTEPLVDIPKAPGTGKIAMTTRFDCWYCGSANSIFYRLQVHNNKANSTSGLLRSLSLESFF